MMLVLFSSEQEFRIRMESLLVKRKLMFCSLGNLDDFKKWVSYHSIEVAITSTRTKEELDFVNSISLKNYSADVLNVDHRCKMSTLVLAVDKFLTENHRFSDRYKVTNELESKDFLLRINTKYKRIAKHDIYFISTDHKYSVIHTDGREYSIRESLKSISQNLGSSFLRVHASFIVNMDKISNIDTINNCIELDNSVTISYSRKYKSELFSCFIVK